METSYVQGLKLAIVGITGLSKDALHIYVGLGIFLVVRLALRKHANSWWPVVAVAIVACLGEALDMRDDIHSLGIWRWRASLHDVVNTVFWPCILHAYLRKTAAGTSY